MELNDKKERHKLLYDIIKAAIFAGLILYILSLLGLFIDRSAKRIEDGVYYRGVEYISCGGRYSSEGKVFAKTDDGFSLKEVTDDKSRTFIVMRSFLDQYLLVRSDYEIPTSGEITVAYLKYNIIKDESFLNVINDIVKMLSQISSISLKNP